ncbi:MAG: glycoside hydrolase family 97 protein [Paludibacteraceae bacterium]
MKHRTIPLILNRLSGILAAVLLLSGCQSATDTTLTSPDGKVQIRFSLSDNGVPAYSVSRNGKPVLLPSALGLETTEQSLTSRFRMDGISRISRDTTWETVWGEERFIRDHHNEMTVHLRHQSGTRMDIVFRAFDDGFAFRYRLPADCPCEEGEENNAPSTAECNPSPSLCGEGRSESLGHILSEQTSYVFARTPEAWSIPWRTEYYEALWTKAPVTRMDTTCSPVTLELADGTYAFLHEAALTDYPAENFYYRGDTIRTFLTPLADGTAAHIRKSSSEGDLENLPWRFMILADDLQGLLASRIMLNLNDPCRIEDTSWIKPMKFIGIWWGMHLKTMTWWNGPQHGATTRRMKQYIDFAADNGFGGVLAEGWNVGWGSWDGPHPGERFSFVTPYPDYDIEALTRYAHQRGVQIIFHHETAGDAANYEAQLDTAYRYIEQHGMHAVKTGYVAPYVRYAEGKQYNRSQAGVQHYRRVIEKAAAHQVAIDNHEPVMPTGLQRTYPNLMTQEGVRGQEWNAWATDGGSPASHVTVLPFTRMLAGPADYTPGVFNFENPVHPGTRVHATLANQLGLFVVLYSPLQMACDLPENYLRHPEAFEFIRRVPCDWERSRLLCGGIGEYAVMARQERGGDNWYIGAVNNDTPREVNIDWSFLPDGDYTMTLWRDGEDADWQTNPYACRIDTLRCRATDRLTIPMASGGGFAIAVIPDKK